MAVDAKAVAMMKGGFKPRLKFPIITIDAGGGPSFSRDEKNTFVKWTKSVAKNEKYYKSLRILDATGSIYKIVDVDILGYSNFFFGLDIYLDQTVIADVYVELVEAPDLSAIKNILLKAIKKDRDYVESGDIDWKKLILDVQAAATLPATMELLAQAQGAP